MTDCDRNIEKPLYLPLGGWTCRPKMTQHAPSEQQICGDYDGRSQLKPCLEPWFFACTEFADMPRPARRNSEQVDNSEVLVIE